MAEKNEKIPANSPSEESHCISKTVLTLTGTILGRFIVGTPISNLLSSSTFYPSYPRLYVLPIILSALMGGIIMACLSSYIFYRKIRRKDLLYTLATFLISLFITVIPICIFYPKFCSLVVHLDQSTLVALMQGTVVALYPLYLFSAIYLFVGFFIFAEKIPKFQNK